MRFSPGCRCCECADILVHDDDFSTDSTSDYDFTACPINTDVSWSVTGGRLRMTATADGGNGGGTTVSTFSFTDCFRVEGRMYGDPAVQGHTVGFGSQCGSPTGDQNVVNLYWHSDADPTHPGYQLLAMASGEALRHCATIVGPHTAATLVDGDLWGITLEKVGAGPSNNWEIKFFRNGSQIGATVIRSDSDIPAGPYILCFSAQSLFQDDFVEWDDLKVFTD